MSEQKARKVPLIRFKGFKGEWEERPLQILADRYDNLRIPVAASRRIPGNTPYYGANGIQGYVQGHTHDGEFILVAEDGANDLQNYPVQYVSGKIWVNNHAHVLRGKSGLAETRFLKYAFSQINVEMFLVGGGRAKLNAETMMRMVFCAPNEIPEQKKISEYFQELDSLLALHQRKHDKLVMLKKAMLQKMFPQSGATTPEIRFKGFSGDWAGKSLGDAMENLANNALSRANLNYRSGLARNVHYGDILVRFGEILDAQGDDVPFVTDDETASKLAPSKLANGDIVLADAAEDEMVGKCTEVQNVGDQVVLAGLHTIPLRPLLHFAPYYLGYFLNSSAYHDQLLPIMQGTKVLSVSKTAIKQTTICFPTAKDEQQKIGSYFRTLDTLIAQHATQLQKLQQIKSACLEKMFV